MHAHIRKYLITALAGTPDVLEHLLAPVAAGDARWDRRPDPDRFTLREVLAHLADWDEIFRGRMEQTARESVPELPEQDEGQMALDRGYACADPATSLARFRASRTATVAFLRGLDDAGWERVGTRGFMGLVSVTDQAVLVSSHDGYHLQQVVEWLGKR